MGKVVAVTPPSAAADKKSAAYNEEAKRSVIMQFTTAAGDGVDRFHGIISRDEADLLLTADCEDEDGRYLIRESQRAKEQYTLAIRCVLSVFVLSSILSFTNYNFYSSPAIRS